MFSNVLKPIWKMYNTYQTKLVPRLLQRGGGRGDEVQRANTKILFVSHFCLELTSDIVRKRPPKGTIYDPNNGLDGFAFV